MGVAPVSQGLNPFDAMTCGEQALQACALDLLRVFLALSHPHPDYVVRVVVDLHAVVAGRGVQEVRVPAACRGCVRLDSRAHTRMISHFTLHHSSPAGNWVALPRSASSSNQPDFQDCEQRPLQLGRTIATVAWACPVHARTWTALMQRIPQQPPMAQDPSPYWSPGVLEC